MENNSGDAATRRELSLWRWRVAVRRELVVWSPDYDGKGKALVRLADGTEAIVGGSRVERG
jgi:hypothetical protein